LGYSFHPFPVYGISLAFLPAGFRLEDIRVPEYVWHGTAVVDTPLVMGMDVAVRILNSHLTICQAEGQLLLFTH
jgi:hypothetical protein